MAKRNGNTATPALGETVEHKITEAGGAGKSNVIPINPQANQETIKALREILRMAERGEVTGMILSICRTGQNHTIGYSGLYR